MNDYIIVENDKMSNHTTYKLEGIIRKVVYPLNEKALIKLIKELKEKNEKYHLLGFGSNVIFESDYYDGVIIKLTKMGSIRINNEIIDISAGYSLMKLSNIAESMSLSGLEALSGIPGTIGGCIVGNAGAYGASMSDIVLETTVLADGEITKFTNDEMDFGYRTSIFKENKNHIILSAKLKLKKGDREEINQIIKELLKKRKETQPIEYPSAGSVFKNPPDDSAGRIIDSLGLKGYRVNNAAISEKHANFIINKGTITGGDVITLINIIKEKVKNELNIELTLEQEIIK